MPTTPGLPLERGSTGEAVRDLQHRLQARELRIDPAEFGAYGTSTEEAVQAFQAEQGLQSDGRCDEATWAALVESSYHLGDRLLYLRRPMLRGDDVAQLQRRLSSLGFDAGRVDGIFGPDTEQALHDFQRNVGLAADGIFGPDTGRAFSRLGNRAEQTVTVAGVRERERWRLRPATLRDRRLAVGHSGELGALAQALRRQLLDRGAHAIVLDHPDPSVQAQEANAFEADVYVGIGVSTEGHGCVAYYQAPGFESFGGHQLADCAVSELTDVLDSSPGEARGMRLPILREARMPAVVCLLTDPSALVSASETIATGLTRAIDRWVQLPSGT